MNNFQLSEQADPNKIFLTKFSELEGRLDPHFYKNEFLENEKKINAIGCTTLKEKSISIFSGITPKSGGDAYCDSNIGIPFVRSGNFVENGSIDLSKLLHIKPGIHNGIMKSSIIKKNDLLIAIVGATIGKIGIYSNKDEVNINQAIAAVRLNKDTKPEFVRAFLSTTIGQKIIDRIKRPVARANLNLDEIGSFKIPNFSLNRQEKIINFMDKAYQDKQAKETKAQELLNSIDTYLLGELGIDLPKQIDNSLKARIFTKKFSEVAGRRFDPDYQKPIYAVIDNALNCSKYEITNLNNASNNIFQGVSRNLTKNTTHTLLKVKNIAKNNEIKFDDVEYVDLYNNNKMKILKSGDIISPFIGEAIKQYKFSVFYETSKKYTIDNNTGVIRLLSNINPIFISAFIMSFYGKKQIDRHLGGGGIPFIGTNGIRQLKIPLPPLEKQTQIAEYISQIRTQAKQLQTEAKTGLEQAKKEIETMILGA